MTSSTPCNIPSGYISITHLPDDQKFDGENYISWREAMLQLGTRKGLEVYWRGNIVDPMPPEEGETVKSTPINDFHPNYYEISICGSVAIATILENIKNPNALRWDGKDKKSSDLWEWLEMEFKSISALTRKTKEEAL
ncbi:hypothetical protein VKT23_012788 [Stygiomarasmius scandens]|uniref:Retrotransposon Copia-like N-terminal domain-containing protein n=1 Tax=Marasmiellus scandens TaxID=2682957 RepID=A0ABR1J581_9AGAR